MSFFSSDGTIFETTGWLELGGELSIAVGRRWRNCSMRARYDRVSHSSGERGNMCTSPEQWGVSFARR